MLEWLSQNLATVIIVAVLAVIFGLLLYSLIRDKKAGRSSCGGGCAGCANACYCHPQAAAKDPRADKKEPAADAKSQTEAHANPQKGGN